MPQETLPPADIYWFAEHFDFLCNQMRDQIDLSGELENDPPIAQLQDAMTQLLDVLQQFDRQLQLPTRKADAVPEQMELSEFSDYGLTIVENLFHINHEMQLDIDPHEWERLAIALALWCIHHGADLSTYTVLVNGLASIANEISDPKQLELLYSTMSEVLDAATMATVEEALYNDADHPWRILLFNRAIVAARSFSAKAILEAFSSIEEYLPEEAIEFFSEGLAQLEKEKFPNEIKELVAQFYRNCEKPIFH